MAQDKSSKKKISTQTQNKIAFGEVVRARLEAFNLPDSERSPSRVIRYSMDDAFVPLGTAMADIAVHVFRGGNRQIRTTAPPLARGGTPVIAWSRKRRIPPLRLLPTDP